MGKFNLYYTSEKEKEEWERFAEKDNRSLSQFIRIAVWEKIHRMKRILEETETPDQRMRRK